MAIYSYTFRIPHIQIVKVGKAEIFFNSKGSWLYWSCLEHLNNGGGYGMISK